MEAAPGTAFQRLKGFDMVVLGGGIAGLTAVWHAARLGLSAALVERGPMFGGQVATLGEIHDYPASAGMSGADLAAALVDAARRDGAAIAEEEVLAVELGGRMPEIRTGSWTLRARTVVVATGASLKPLDVPGAAGREGAGISHCATCDGPLYRNRDAVVVGGGDGALHEALTLVRYCRQVSVVVRGRLRARQAYIDAAARCANLAFVWDSEIDSLLGENSVTAVRVRNRKTAAVSEIPCFGVFPFIGSTPNSGFLPATVERTPSGHVRVDQNFESAVAGLCAIGAARDGFGGSLVSAAGEGAAVAARVAARLRR